MSYEIIDGHKATIEHSGRSFQREASGREVLALDDYAAIEYRDDQHRIFHRYFLPLKIRGFTHYLKYFGTSFFDLSIFQIKFHTIHSILMVMRKLAPLRKKVSILEIGASLGENYILLRDVVRREKLDLEIEFVGIDIDQNVVEMAQELHHGDPNFSIYLKDGADLSQFPDRCFDIVFSNGVLNYVDNPESAYGNAIRIARVCSVLNTLFSRTGSPFTVTLSGGALLRAMAMTKPIIVKQIRPHAPVFVFDMNFFWGFQDYGKATNESDGVFIGRRSEKDMERKLLIFSRVNIFPELHFIREDI